VGGQHSCLHKMSLNLKYQMESAGRKLHVTDDTCVIRCIRKIAKKKKGGGAISFVMSVRTQGTRLPLDGFSRNLIFEDFSKICRVNSRFIKI
jgi:hypothetical protein